MSFKDEVKNLIIANLANSEQQTIVDELKQKILTAINLPLLPLYVEQVYPVEWDNEDTTMLEMMISSSIGVKCNLNNGIIQCPLILFFE